MESRERCALHPDRKRAALALALAHAHFGAGALEAAEREFRDAVALEPENADARCGLVVTLANLFRLDEAERELHAAEQSGVRLSPSVRGEIEKRRGAGPS
ncbi:MAG: tetratricopeptide repeat protein [Burkholderiales bacterium]|jgi:Flp pilus assembly protein TadD